MATTTELTQNYISKHSSIKDCLKKGLINYSALSRQISKELDISGKSSKEAILIAARRYKDKIKSAALEDDVIKLFENSNLDIKNNIVVFTIDKNIYPDSLIEIEKKIKNEGSLFFLIEGTKSITIILQKQSSAIVEKRFKKSLMLKKEDLVLVTLTSKGIGKTPGAVSYISSIFFENEINIEEFMSCYDDTLIVIEKKNLSKIMEILSC